MYNETLFKIFIGNQFCPKYAILYFLSQKFAVSSTHLNFRKVKILILVVANDNVRNNKIQVNYKNFAKTEWCKIYDFQYIMVRWKVLKTNTL